MTTTYRLKDGDRVVATSPADFLHQLHIGSRFDSEGTDTEYMHRFAQRLQELEGYFVSTESPDAFLADLVAHGFVIQER
uniref:CRIB domain-containing protein n=1 Tax=Prevotella sp. GTC17262 TaxID=3236797 RepID=A0AB33JCY3_9BACT